MGWRHAKDCVPAPDQRAGRRRSRSRQKQRHTQAGRLLGGWLSTTLRSNNPNCGSVREDAGSISTKLPYRAPRLSEAYHARDRGIFLNFECSSCVGSSSRKALASFFTFLSTLGLDSPPAFIAARNNSVDSSAPCLRVALCFFGGLFMLRASQHLRLTMSKCSSDWGLIQASFFMPNEQFCTDSTVNERWVKDKWRSPTPSHEMSGESAIKAPAPSVGPGLPLSTTPSPEIFQPPARPVLRSIKRRAVVDGHGWELMILCGPNTRGM